MAQLAITFQLVIGPPQAEQVGSNMNPWVAGMNNGDTFPDNPALAQKLNAYRANNVVSYIPGELRGETVEMKNGAQFTAYGQRATYLKFNYGIGVIRQDGTPVPANQQWLQIVSEQWV